MVNRNYGSGDDWITPHDFFTQLNREFHFDFDPCPFQHDVSLWDGLKVEWGKSNFVNPPYSKELKEAFIKKGLLEFSKGKSVVMLLPVSTSTKVFHEILVPHCEIRFVKGRLKFAGYNSKGEWVDNKCGMHDSMVCVFRQ